MEKKFFFFIPGYEDEDETCKIRKDLGLFKNTCNAETIDR